MKSLREYIIESKQTYEFKIKLAGDHENIGEQIKTALCRFDVSKVSTAQRTPIQETYQDFPAMQNINITIYDVELSYPATSVQVQSAISESLNIPSHSIKVRNMKEHEEELLNHQHDEKTGKALLGTDYALENHQSQVGNNRTMDLLKELGKTKHQGTQYKGVNDEILAKSVPYEKTNECKVDDKIGTISVVGSRKTNKTSTKR